MFNSHAISIYPRMPHPSHPTRRHTQTPPRAPVSASVAAEPLATTTKIHIISQAQFDAMPKAQQDFVRGRIAAGQIQIGSPPAAPAQSQKPTTNSHLRQHVPSALNRYRTKPVKVHLTAGQTITGIVTEIWPYEVVVTTPANTAVTILKHAISRIEDDATPESESKPK